MEKVDVRESVLVGEIGVIKGIRVRAKFSLEPRVFNDFNATTCTKCVFNRAEFGCQGGDPNRPACFATDPDNKNRKSIYFVNE